MRQIELAVEIGTARKFAGFGEPGAKVQATRQQHVQHDRAAMALQFEDVFAGVGVGSRKIEQQAGVDQTAISGAEISQRRHTGAAAVFRTALGPRPTGLGRKGE